MKKRKKPGPAPRDPKLNKHSYATKLPWPIINYLRHSDNAAALIEKLIRRTKDFKEFDK